MTFRNRKAAAAAALSFVACCILAGSARADLLYQFSLNASGGIHAAAFSFTVPTFVTTGESPAFTPFTLTDGTHTWTFVEGVAANLVGLGCFAFGTGGTATLGPDCGTGVQSSPDAAFLLQMDGGLPTATGTYSLDGRGIFDFPGGQQVLGIGGAPHLTGNLVITIPINPVPEPSMWLLVPTAVGLAWLTSKKTLRCGATRHGAARGE